MHREAYEFVARALRSREWRGVERVVEIGGRDINGSVRPLFGRAASYTAVDILPGYGVDVVCDGATYRHREPIDLAVCCEVFEHTPSWKAIVENLAAQLAPGGVLLLTMASTTREPHSAIDGQEPRHDEHYANVSPSELMTALVDAGLVGIAVETARDGQDVYAYAQQSAGALQLPQGPPTVEAQNRSYRILMVHPGASVSTADVHAGLLAGLRAEGHQIWEYALDGRIHRSGAWLDYCWRKGGKTVNKPTAADILYHAGEELVARALRIQPDVVLIVSAMYLHPDVLVLLRRARLRVAMLLTESPYDDEKQARLVPWTDVVWTNERVSAEQMGVRYLRHAWHPDVHKVETGDEVVPAHDVVFVGTGFEERIETLSGIDFGDLDVGLYGSWDLLGSRNRLRKFVRGGYISNAKAAALYRRAKVGLNLYRTSQGFGLGAPRIARAESLNPRAYELAATGCFTISDHRDEVVEVFGDLVPTFTTPAEATALIHQWVRDDVGRARVRAALPAAVSTATWHARAAQVIRDLSDSGIVALGNPHHLAGAEQACAVGGG